MSHVARGKQRCPEVWRIVILLCAGRHFLLPSWASSRNDGEEGTPSIESKICKHSFRLATAASWKLNACLHGSPQDIGFILRCRTKENSRGFYTSEGCLNDFEVHAISMISQKLRFQGVSCGFIWKFGQSDLTDSTEFRLILHWFHTDSLIDIRMISQVTAWEKSLKSLKKILPVWNRP